MCSALTVLLRDICMFQAVAGFFFLSFQYHFLVFSAFLFPEQNCMALSPYLILQE